MKKIWFSSKELTAIDGLPSTTQGINRRARVEKWQRRKRSGIQGRAIEYHIDSLPAFVKTALKRAKIGHGQQKSRELIKVWMSAYFSLTTQEQQRLITWLLRQGVEGLLSFVAASEQNKFH